MMNKPYINFDTQVDKESSGQRIDHFAIKYFEENEEKYEECNQVFSRTKIQKFILDGNILVNDVPVKASYIVKEGSIVQFNIPVEVGERLETSPEKIYFEILYNDNDIIVINKPMGLVVHPAQGHYEHTLVNGLLFLFPEMKRNTNLSRMGLVHRLDKDTSGVMIVTKNEIAQEDVIDQFKHRTVTKEYVAIVNGIVKDDNGVISTRIGRNPLNRKRMSVLITDGKESLTKYEVLRVLKNATFIKLMPLTGRTHQLRVHMNYLKHPIAGDDLYSKRRTGFHRLGLMLCAKKITFIHPRTRQEMSFEVDLPDRFKIILQKGEV
ncbi:MAG: RluA family pseudouridine synthase [Spirochaetes bacterium]|nr:RluA family pseudouridine synthase [Spirochaetota bacterium]